MKASEEERASVLIFASVTRPILWHMRVLAAFYEIPRTIAILHGGLSAALRRPRYNLAARWLSLGSAMAAAPSALSFAVLEKHILETVQNADSRLAHRIDLFPHPLPPDLLEGGARVPPETPPIKIGLLGLCTPQKGLFTFLRLAQRLTGTLVGNLEFHIVGRIHSDHLEQAQRYSEYLTIPTSSEPLPRNRFVDELARLHYAAFFFDGRHYDATASGVLLDCIALGIPLIGRRHPLIDALRESAGNIGEFCEEGQEEAMVRQLVERFDRDRYREQQANMLSLREARMPQALATYLQSAARRQFR
jgi:hypothetical protein